MAKTEFADLVLNKNMSYYYQCGKQLWPLYAFVGTLLFIYLFIFDDDDDDE